MVNFEGTSLPSSPVSSTSREYGSSANQPSRMNNDEDLINTFLSGPTLLQTDEPGALPILKPPPLTPSLAGLELFDEMVRRRAWSDVIDISLNLLTSADSPHHTYYTEIISGEQKEVDKNPEDNFNVSKTIHIMVWRLRAHRFLRKYSELQQEIVRLRLSPLNIDKMLSWMPSILIFEGLESATYIEGEDSQVVMDVLCKLRDELMKFDNRKDELFKLDVLTSNICTRKQDWRLALSTLDRILTYTEDAVRTWMKNLQTNFSWLNLQEDDLTHQIVDVVSCAIKVELYSRQGRILLQAGALPAAAMIFERAHDVYEAMKNENDDLSEARVSIRDSDLVKSPIVRNVPTQILLNEGLLHFAHLDYDLAQEKFTRAIETLRREWRNQGQLENRLTSQFLDLLACEGNILIPCITNLALSFLYTCRIRDAILMLEALIREDAAKYLTECLAFNLCTMYELGYDTTKSNEKKRALQLVSQRFSLQDIGKECFRLA